MCDPEHRTYGRRQASTMARHAMLRPNPYFFDHDSITAQTMEETVVHSPTLLEGTGRCAPARVRGGLVALGHLLCLSRWERGLWRHRRYCGHQRPPDGGLLRTVALGACA